MSSVPQQIQQYDQQLIERLCEAIERATKTLKVCAPITAYYRRADEWTEIEIQYVDPVQLIATLKDEE